MPGKAWRQAVSLQHNMPTWFLSKTFWIIAAVIIAFSALAYITNKIYDAGGDGAKLEQADAQIKHNAKAKHIHDKIVKETPYSADRITRGKWVQKYTRHTGE